MNDRLRGEVGVAKEVGQPESGLAYLLLGHIGREAAFDGDPYLLDSILYVRLFGLVRGASTTSAICPCSAPVHEVAWPVASVPLGT